MKKKVLFRIPSMEMGGAQKAMLNIINFLDSSKYEPILLLNSFKGELLLEIPRNTKIFFLVEGIEKPNCNGIQRLLHRTKNYIILGKYCLFPTLLKKKLNIVPDIEIAMVDSSLKDLVNSPFKHSRKLNWFHADLHFYSQVYGKEIVSMMHKCHLTVFVSHKTKGDFETYLKQYVYNSLCIYNAFNIEDIRSKSLESFDLKEWMLFKRPVKTFVSVGRLVDQKGYDILIEAHSELIKEGFNHQIIVIGDGPEYRSLKKEIILQNVENSFLLLGLKENPYPYIAKADYYIQPSRYEGYPLAVAEALILHIPLISTCVGGVMEIIDHNKTGYLTGFSKYELKNAMMKFLLEPDFVMEIVRNQKRKDFTLHNEYIHEQLEYIFK
ncbi:glycosyltransferase [Chryseobacterium potabilaquae]|uniref:N-acetylgalactosamine-N, N'-diacetylbacillosaminyl-diphospho-undecaprenol 4-alpha-N-acetylgalactosaminyltransferase n=1 Tax=Chryseobacterium potabilaquae TaxID=2675057 RepID=A0A6N4X675_9FLAO|nr:glycosyltransferase [Chryseobacterium potabilaquae]CAA7196530.1 N-acetylgalactosamine-N, N'-diacetylbacillosaminyl-diphospho-undecaprenol 4-alpha-N-acetylgalactosaminyltransferase [Chryseobacterium potabilaquae]